MLFVGLGLTLVGYAAAILIVTSQRARMIRLVLAIAIGTGTLTGVALWARYVERVEKMLLESPRD